MNVMLDLYCASETFEAAGSFLVRILIFDVDIGFIRIIERQQHEWKNR